MARGLAVAVVAVVLLVAAAPAMAASGTFTCDQIQNAVNNAQHGDVITLDSSADPGGLCDNAITIDLGAGSPTPPEYKTWTLKGRDGQPDGFDGSSLPGRMITGVNVHKLTIQGLTFRDGDQTGNGGAISITGESSLSLFLSTFVNNSATGKGGAVYLAPVKSTVLGVNLFGTSINGNTFDDNRAQEGGALAVDFPGQGQNSSYRNNTFTDNVASHNGGAFTWVLDTSDMSGENFSVSDNVVTGNRASGVGGGGYIVQHGALRIDNERYEGNRIDPAVGTPPVNDHFGGGLYVEHNGLTIHRNNVFRSNAILTAPMGENYGGAGLALFGGNTVDIQSQFARYESNTLPAAPVGFESEGGGLYLEAPNAHWYSFLDTFAGNSAGAGGEGGGLYVGGGGTVLELGEVTVAGNSVGAGGQFAGIAGGGFDDLIMRNSIVFNTPQPDIGGFDFFDVQFSDACTGGAPFAGPGNICADPRLVGGTDVHQTTASPTIDAGSDELFMSEGGERPLTDFEGDPRPTDGDGDGNTVDMGADETPAGFSAPPPPPPPATPQCSDQVDNDGDGAIDLADPGCLPGPTDDNEGDESLQDVFLCGERTISLVRADARGRRVVLSGIVASSVAGQPIDLSVRYLGRRASPRTLGTVTAGPDGQFRARVPGPPRRLFKFARYRASVGNARSVELKLPQSLASSSLRAVGGGMLELRGQVDRKLVGRRNAVVVRRILCGQYTTVGQARPNRRGAYVVRFPAPAAASGGAALYRAESRVLARPGSKRYVRQFARAIGITF
jgi:hypothetical protein